jgi:hypothetical protein
MVLQDTSGQIRKNGRRSGFFCGEQDDQEAKKLLRLNVGLIPMFL